jgi:rod shape-determining protein MreC
MERIFLFIYQYRAFFTFLLLEILGAWMFIVNNRFPGARFFNSANRTVAAINGISQNVGDYFALWEINRELAEENALLRSKGQPFATHTASKEADSTLVKRFDFVSARVMNNSVSRFTNFITINKGALAGIEPGMAVISQAGAIGKVKVTSDHFSVVSSLLNIDLMISAVLKRTGHFGTVQWEGYNPEMTSLKYIPRHVKPEKGDTVITSGYSGVFPEGILIGTVAEARLSKEAPFYTLRIKLAQDFQKLSYVTVVKSNLLQELDSLELQVPEMKQ